MLTSLSAHPSVNLRDGGGQGGPDPLHTYLLLLSSRDAGLLISARPGTGDTRRASRHNLQGVHMRVGGGDLRTRVCTSLDVATKWPSHPLLNAALPWGLSRLSLRKMMLLMCYFL